MPESVEVVNVVGSGNLCRELDLDAVLQDIAGTSSIESVDRTSQGITVRFSDETGTISLYRSGKYTIMGSDSVEGLHRTNETFLEILIKYGIIKGKNGHSVSVTNYVYSVDLDRDINITQLDIWLGEEAEYEPEQFPYIVYHPSDIDCTMTISASGKCVINTSVGEEAVNRVISKLKQQLDELQMQE